MLSSPRSKQMLTVVAVTVMVFGLFPSMAIAGPVEDDVRLEQIASGLGVLTDLDAPSNDHRVFISTLNGRIWIWEHGEIQSTPFLDISGLIGSGEHGLLSFTFHPEYASNGKIYVHYVNGNSETQIAEYTVSGNPDRINHSSGDVLFETNQPFGNHNGGSIDFGPDGNLYIALGDGGSQHDPAETSQNINTYLGAILRLDVDGGNPYAIPDDNPFVGAPGLDEIWVYGFRNPWRMAWDLEKERLYVADVGQGAREEVNVIKPGHSGRNYGWDVMEGSICHEPSSGCNTSGKTLPDLEYTHSEGISITGGHVYRGRELPRLDGHYFYADWGTGFIRSFKFKNGEVTNERDWTSELGSHPGIISFGTDGFGELYFVTGGGSVYRFSAVTPPSCDFDGDGYDDLAAGAPGEDLPGAVDAGAVHILYGAGNGLKASGDQFFTQDSPGVRNSAETGDGFGSALSCGDFNGDGFGDLAIGAPHEGVSGDSGAGAVHILHGTPSGLKAGDDQFWTQDSPGISNKTEPEDHFGYSLESGDFNGDGFSDLAIGVPDEDVQGHADAGIAHVLYGSASGLTADSSQIWDQDSSGIGNKVEAGDRFASTLAAGDFDGDYFMDLAVGVPNEGVSGISEAGLVNVIYGRGSGLSSSGDQVWSQETSGVTNPAESGDMFGSALESGDFDGDGEDDLAVGVPNEGVDGNAGAGAVHVIMGSGSGLTASGDQFWTQDTAGIANGVEAGDGFGGSLAAGRFDDDDYEDLAVAAPSEGVSGVSAAGAAHVIYGSSGGLDDAGDQYWHQDSTGVSNKVELDDRFGQWLSARDYNSDGLDDLTVGVPDEDIDGFANAGITHVLYGTNSGVSATDDDAWHQNSGGILDSVEVDDGFGVLVLAE